MEDAGDGFCLASEDKDMGYPNPFDMINLLLWFDAHFVSVNATISPFGNFDTTFTISAGGNLMLTGGGGGGAGAANNGPANSPANPPPCQAKVLNATNNQFGTNYTDANVNSTFNFSTGAPPGQGTLNLNIYGSTAGVSPGYYPVHWWTYAIGYGPTLHAVSGPGGNGGLDSTQTLPFGPNQATFHIDSGFPYNPIGAFFHWLLNMTKAGGYPQC